MTPRPNADEQRHGAGAIMPSHAVSASPAPKMPLRTAEEVAELKRMWDELDPAVKQQLEEEGRREFEANPNGRLVVGGSWLGGLIKRSLDASAQVGPPHHRLPRPLASITLTDRTQETGFGVVQVDAAR